MRIPVPPQRNPQAARLYMVCVVTSVLTLVWLWLPWTSVTAQDSFGNSRSLSSNGFRTIPESCFLTCAPTSTSIWAILLVIASALAALCGVVWLLSAEPVVLSGGALVVAAVAMMFLTMINAGVLYVETLTITDSHSGASAYPGIGPFVAMATSVATLVCAIRARDAAHRSPWPGRRTARTPRW